MFFIAINAIVDEYYHNFCIQIILGIICYCIAYLFIGEFVDYASIDKYHTNMLTIVAIYICLFLYCFRNINRQRMDKVFEVIKNKPDDELKVSHDLTSSEQKNIDDLFIISNDDDIGISEDSIKIK